MSKKPPKDEAQKARGRNGARVRGSRAARQSSAADDLFAEDLEGDALRRGAQKLNPREIAFCEHYIREANGTEAARLAGYKGNDATLAVAASRLLKKDKIRAHLKTLQAEVSGPRILSAKERLEILSEIVTGEAEGRGTFFGEPVTTHPTFGERVRAAELISKMQGELSEKREHEGEVVVRVVRSNKAPSAIGTQEKDNA